MRVLLLVWMLCWCLVLGAQVADPIDTLNEAEDYLTVNPAHSILLLENMAKPDTLPEELFVRWHLLAMRASVPTNQMPRLIESLEAVFSVSQSPYFRNQITSILSALGIWLRRSQYYQDAQISLDCSYKYAQNDRQRLTLTNSLALVAREQRNHSKARALYARSRTLAEQLQQTPVLAMIENNLGALALDEGKVDEAERLFRQALTDYQELDKRSGKISAGINLLFVFLIKEQTMNYQRLIGPTSRLTSIFPNESKQALLSWLQARFEQLQGKAPDDKVKLALKVAYDELESDTVRAWVHKYLAPKLVVEVTHPLIPMKKSFEEPWFDAVKECDWQ